MAIYSTQIEKAIEKIKKQDAKLVCIQLPDGMKTKSKEIVDTLEQETKARVLIWLGSNFGACDIPQGLEKLKVDLLISWGHNVFEKQEGW